MDKIIEIKNLKKYFNEVKAVDDISFEVEKGEFFAFLGINGAGKSTTINIICGQLAKDSGSVIIDGNDVDTALDEIKSKIGVVFQDGVLDKQLTVKDNLESRAVLYGISGKEFQARLDELSTALEFKDLLNRPLCKLSGGQKRRIDIARALVHKPEILILDEPTTGLDPKTRKKIWEVINGLRKTDRLTVFLTTHYMEETVDADYIVILDSGKIVAKGTPLELKNQYTGDYITVYGVTEESVKSLDKPYEKIRDAFRVSVKNTAEAKELIINNADLFNDFEITKGKMDDVFLTVTGKNLGGN